MSPINFTPVVGQELIYHNVRKQTHMRVIVDKVFASVCLVRPVNTKLYTNTPFHVHVALLWA